MYLRDLDIWADEEIVDRFPSQFVQWFKIESSCIVEWYRQLIRRSVVTPDAMKVCLIFAENDCASAGGFEPRFGQIKILEHVIIARERFDFAKYHAAGDVNKKRMVLESLHNGLLDTAEERRWCTESVNALQRCHDEIVASDLEFEGLCKASTISPDRKYRARVGYRWGMRKVDLEVAVFRFRGAELGRKPVGSTLPFAGLIYDIEKAKSEWRRSNKFRITPFRRSFSRPDFLKLACQR